MSFTAMNIGAVDNGKRRGIKQHQQKGWNISHWTVNTLCSLYLFAEYIFLCYFLGILVKSAALLTLYWLCIDSVLTSSDCSVCVKKHEHKIQQNYQIEFILFRQGSCLSLPSEENMVMICYSQMSNKVRMFKASKQAFKLLSPDDNFLSSLIFSAQ